MRFRFAGSWRKNWERNVKHKSQQVWTIRKRWVSAWLVRILWRRWFFFIFFVNFSYGRYMMVFYFIHGIIPVKTLTPTIGIPRPNFTFFLVFLARILSCLYLIWVFWTAGPRANRPCPRPIWYRYQIRFETITGTTRGGCHPRVIAFVLLTCHVFLF